MHAKLGILTHSVVEGKQGLTMADLVLHAVLHDKKNYHLFRLECLIKTACRNEK